MTHSFAHVGCQIPRRTSLAIALTACLWGLFMPLGAQSASLPTFPILSQVIQASPNPQEAVSTPKLPPPEAVSTSVTPSEVQLGEPFTLFVQITHQEGLSYAPAGDFGLGKDGDVLSLNVAQKPLGNGSVMTSIEVKGAVFNLGDVKFSQLNFTASDGITEEPFSIEGPTIACSGKLAEGEKAPMNDILSPVSVNIPSYVILWAALISLALLGLFFLGLKWWRNRKPSAPKAIPAPPPAPLDVRALNALRGLLAEGNADQGQSQQRQMFFRLSEIERSYLGERYHFGAMDMTSEELMTALRKRHTPGLDFGKLEMRCREGDFIRYAKASLPASECVQAVNDSMDMVMKTSACEANRLRGEEAAKIAYSSQAFLASSDITSQSRSLSPQDLPLPTKVISSEAPKSEQIGRQP